jgi:hypothetical protein
MRAVLLLLIGSMLRGICPAQECYLVDSIRSTPAAPTDEDAIGLTLYGDLIGARTTVIAASAEREDRQIVIRIDARCDSNAALVLPHREQLSLAALPVGRYRIRFAGKGAVLMDTAASLFVAPYAGRYQSAQAPAGMMRFDAQADQFILDLDPSLYVVRLRVYDADARMRREAFIDGFGPTRISAKDLPDGNYLIRVDTDTYGVTRWATVNRK